MSSEVPRNYSIPSQNGPRAPEVLDVSLTNAVLWLWRRKFRVVGSSLLVSILFVLYSYTIEPVYTAQVTMLPRGAAPSSGLLGQVASFTGKSLELEDNFEGLYGQIATSDPIVKAALKRKWQHKDYPDSASLYEIFSIEREEGKEDFLFARLKRKLNSGVITFSRDKNSGFMVLRTSVPGDRNTAAELGNFIADQIQDFNQSFSNRKAAEKREFLEIRIEELHESLDAVATEITNFSLENRSFRNSPVLLQQHNSLEREMQARTAVWIEMTRQLEIAKLDELKEVVSVNVLDRAIAPEKKSRPKRFFFLVGGGLLGFIGSIGMIFSWEKFSSVSRATNFSSGTPGVEMEEPMDERVPYSATSEPPAEKPVDTFSKC